MKTLAILFTLFFVCGAYADVKVYNDGRVAIDGVIVGTYKGDYDADVINSLFDWNIMSVSGEWDKEKPCCCECRCDSNIFKPMKDITAYELALIIDLIHGRDLDNFSCKEFRVMRRHLKCAD
jgi:hypothetical protein